MTDWKEEKDNIGAGAEPETADCEVNESPEEEKEELSEKEELENLAAMFQRELDKAKEREERMSDWDELASVPAGEIGDDIFFEENSASAAEDGEADEEEKEKIDETLCVRCGKNKKPTDEEGEILDDYCDDCMTARLSTHVSWVAGIFFAILLAVTAFAGRELVKSSDSFMTLMRAAGYRAEHRYTSAVDTYYAALQGGIESDYVVKNMIACYENSDLAIYVAELLTQLGYDEKELQKPWNYTLKKAYEKSEKIALTAEAAEKAIDDNTNADTGAFDFDAASKKLDELQQDKQYDPAIVQYYRYYAATVAGKDLNAQLEILTAEKKYIKSHGWLFEPKIAMVKAQLRQTDEALEMCAEMKKENKEWGEAYFLEVYALRLAGKYEEAAQKADAGVEAFNGTIGDKGDSDRYALSELYRQRAITAILAGDSKAGAEFAEKAHDTYQTVDTCNLLGICYALAKDEESYKNMEDFLKENGYEYEKDVKAVKNGEKTAADIFTSERGEIQ